jgi:hypothetical protein
MSATMDTDLSSEPTAAAICDALGRKRIAERVGRRPTAVSNAASEGVFPASWYLAISEMCAEAGIACPARLFSFIAAGEEGSTPDQKDVA